jgi:hypothetical protein
MTTPGKMEWKDAINPLSMSTWMAWTRRSWEDLNCSRRQLAGCWNVFLSLLGNRAGNSLAHPFQPSHDEELLNLWNKKYK